MSYFMKHTFFRKALTCAFSSHFVDRSFSKHSVIVLNKFRSALSQTLTFNNDSPHLCHRIVVSARTQSTSAISPSEDVVASKKYKIHADWLPFPWTRRPKFNIFKQGGDLITISDPNLNLPKAEYALSQRLEHSNEQVKKMFTLHTADLWQVRAAEEAALIKKVQRHPMDFDSLEVIIAKRTARIRHLFRVQQQVKKPRRYNVYLQQEIQQRNRYLLVLYKSHRESFDWLLKQLNLECRIPSMAVKQESYCRKWDLRRLTREYCENMRNEKFAAYHEELKSMQKEFLREKEETLAWIAKEEEELGVSADKPKNLF